MWWVLLAVALIVGSAGWFIWFVLDLANQLGQVETE